MTRLLLLGVRAACSLIPMLAFCVAHAQGTTVNFNLAAGLTVPTSTFGDAYNSGYNIVAGIGMAQRGSALGFQAEGIYDEFTQKNGGSGNASVGGVTGNVIYDLVQPSSSQANTVYLTAGIGFYSTREPNSFFSPTAQTNTGWDFGGGFKFPLSGFSAYIEARYHTVSNTDVKIVPISFGLVF